jgi:hypothetical protein
VCTCLCMVQERGIIHGIMSGCIVCSENESFLMFISKLASGHEYHSF